MTSGGRVTVTPEIYSPENGWEYLTGAESNEVSAFVLRQKCVIEWSLVCRLTFQSDRLAEVDQA